MTAPGSDIGALAGALWTRACERAVDVALVGAGAGLATASTVFAIYMSVQGGAPRINGQEHLTVFAQLKGVPPNGVAQRRPPPPADVDPVVTGALGETRRQSPPAPPARRFEGFRVVALSDGAAEIAAGGRTWRVRVGDVTPLFGRIAAIRAEGGDLVVETDNGAIVSPRR